MIIEKLKKLERESIKRGIPIIGSEKGKWLLKIIKEEKPKEILELGTANGYSGIILGSEGAELLTVELAEKSAEEAKENFEKFKINAKIILGDAVEVVKKLNKKFDLIFIDFAKKDYIDVLEDCIRLTNKTIIADNVNVEDCKDFKKAILNHDKLKTEIIGDLSFSRLALNLFMFRRTIS